MQRILLVVCALSCAGVGQGLAQERTLSIPGSNAQRPFHADPKPSPYSAPGYQDFRFSIPSHGGSEDSCAGKLQKEKELTALLKQKIVQLEAQLADLQVKVAKTGAPK